MDIHTDQLTQLLREQIEKFDGSVDVAEVGEVIEVGDGVARASGLENVMSSELVELPNGVFGMALNLEEDNVGVVLFGETRLVKEGDSVSPGDIIAEVETDKATIEVAFNYSEKFKKFQNPENWLLQMIKMADIDLIPSPDLMGTYDLGMKPLNSQRVLEKLLKELGHHPYLAKQPNGWSDISQDWMSPELMIRRLVYAKQAYFKMQPKNQNNEFYDEMIKKNLDNPD